MIAFEGTVRGNTVVVEDGDISAYNGNTVIVTVLDKTFLMTQKNKDSRPLRRAGTTYSIYRDSDNPKTADFVKGDSFQKLLRLKKGFQFDENFDAEKEIEEALQEKYGSID